MHERTFSFMCDQCCKPFVDSYDLKRHIANVHALIKKFICEICNKGFGTKAHYTDHVTRVHEKSTQVPCEHCGKMMSDKKVLKRHIMNKHNRDSCPHQCPICLKKYPFIASLIRHISKSHEKHDSIQCELCDQVFAHKLCVEYHVKKAHALQMLVPPPTVEEPDVQIVEQPKPKKEPKKKQKKAEAPDIILLPSANEKFICQICKMEFSTKKGHTRHIKRVHEKQGRVKCEFCGKVVCSETNLKRHILSVHSDGKYIEKTPKPFACELCEKGFELKKSYVKHMKSVHQKEGRVKCEYCGKEMSSENSLAQHVMSVHERDQCPFECEFCGKKFSRDSHLTRHLEEVHANLLQENESCEECSEKFHNSLMLQMHVKRVHKAKSCSRSSPGGTKIPQECEHCGKVLADQDTLKKHILSMHNRDACPFKCHFCNKRFAKNSALLRHKKYVHNDEDTSEEEEEDDYDDYDDDLENEQIVEKSEPEQMVISELLDVKVKVEQVLEDDVEEMKIEPEIHQEMLIKQEIKEEVKDTFDDEQEFPPWTDNDQLDQSFDEDASGMMQVDFDKSSDIVDDQDTDMMQLEYQVEKVESQILKYEFNLHDDDNDDIKADEDSTSKPDEINNEHCPKKVTDFVKCQACLTVFQSNEDCDAHACIEETNDGENEPEQYSSAEEVPDLPFKCKKCDKQYNNRGSLRRHVREEHEDLEKSGFGRFTKVRENICTLCDTMFDQSYLLKLHLKKAHNVTDHVPGQVRPKHKCKLCDKVYCRKESVRRHIREDHEGRKQAQSGETYKCQQCDKVYGRKDALRRHVRLIHEAVQAGYCDSCDGAFFRDITRHVIVAHTNQEKPVECPDCGKTIGKNYSLKRHLRDCREAMTPKLCDLCGASCENKEELKKHKKKAHKNPNLPKEPKMENGEMLEKKSYGAYKYPCPHCEKSITGKAGLRIHIQTIHEKRRDFMCAECGKAFTQKGALDLHIKGIHRNPEKAAGYSCPKCDKVWTSERGRQLHMEKTHNEKYIYSCQPCSVTFDSKASLKIHIQKCTAVKS